MSIDLDRGVSKRIDSNGIAIHMYKDQPGIYYTHDEKIVSPEMAANAGFPVEDHEKERRRRDRIAQATALIDEQFQSTGRGKVVHKRGAFRAVEYGPGGYVIEDDDGNRLNQGYLTLDAARNIVDTMSGKRASSVPEPEGEDGPPERADGVPDGEPIHDSDGDGTPDPTPPTEPTAARRTGERTDEPAKNPLRPKT